MHESHLAPPAEDSGSNDSLQHDQQQFNNSDQPHRVLEVNNTAVLVSLESDADRIRHAKEHRARAREQARAALARTRQLESISTRLAEEVTLTAEHADETPVLLQRQYRGWGVLANDIANRPCSSFGITRLLDALNRVFGTKDTLDTPFIRPLVQRCIDESLDFGTAYGHLRTRWHLKDFESTATYWRGRDQQSRADALEGDRVVNPLVSPRRVWDLYSNRVLPYWVMNSRPVPSDLWAISHSWAPVANRQDVLTDINGRKWPVPIPKDTTLERVRIELLNLGAEYVWLDVLCLRQWGGEEEELRKEEWKLDVPTIGQVYHADRNRTVVCYFSGLGRPFTVEKDFLADERHWFNRAWTLQETNVNRKTAGLTDSSPIDNGEGGNEDGDRFYQLLSELTVMATERPANIFPVLCAMQKRASVNPVDKVAGLAYLLQATSVPIYKEDEAVENAWERLVENMRDGFRGDMLFLFPHPGESRWKWCPSWRQVLETELPSGAGVSGTADLVRIVPEDLVRIHPDAPDGYFQRAYTISGCFVQGFAETGKGSAVRRGGIVVTSDDSTQYAFPVFARHQVPIPEAQYILVAGGGLEYWVVCRNSGWFMATNYLVVEKVSVLKIGEEARARLERLRLAQKKDVFYM